MASVFNQSLFDLRKMWEEGTEVVLCTIHNYAVGTTEFKTYLVISASESNYRLLRYFPLFSNEGQCNYQVSVDKDVDKSDGNLLELMAVVTNNFDDLRIDKD